MRAILLLLLFGCSVYALNDIAVPYTFSDSGIIYASEHNANFDSLETRVNQLNDSLDIRFIRFSDFTSHDSTLRYLKVDTIRSNPDVDSLKGLNVVRGNPDIDSISGLNVVRGNPDIDSISGLNVVRGNPDIDSMCGLNVVRGDPDFDSAQIGVIRGMNVIRGNPDIDSISGSPRIGTNLTVTGNCLADSVYSTKGIVGTTINTGAGNFEIGQNLRTTDDVTFDSVYAAKLTSPVINLSGTLTTAWLYIDTVAFIDSNALMYGSGSIQCGDIQVADDAKVSDSLYAERLTLGYEEASVTSNAITVTESYVRAIGEASTDTISTITGGNGVGDMLILFNGQSSSTLRLDAAGNIDLPASGVVSLAEDEHALLVYGLASKWYVVSVQN